MKISAVQTDIRIADPASSLETFRNKMASEAAAGSRLVVFPECFASGYCFRSRDEILCVAEPLDGPFVTAATEICRDCGCSAVFGMLERDGSRLFNTAVLTGPDGVVGSYRKVHLPWLGADRFVDYGDRPFEVFSVEGLRVGMLICYDGGFPEAARCLALDGADLIVLPTNWPPGAEYLAEYAGNCRALENSIYFLASSRVGTERGFRFIGKSRICGPSGKTLAAADHTRECVLQCDIDPQAARHKRIIRVPGQHVIDRLADRRPEMYGRLCEPHDLPRPGRDDNAR